MKKLLIILIAAILISVSIITIKIYNTTDSENKTLQNNTPTGTSSQSNNASGQAGINPGIFKTKAIDFKLKDLSGKELSLSDLKGKKVFLNFWATWCPPCKAEMPEIEKIYQETKNSSLVIAAIEIGEPLSTVKSFINDNNYNFKVLLDSDKSVAAKYNVSAIPTSYFIDAKGNIVSKHVGAMDINQMRAYIKNLDN